MLCLRALLGGLLSLIIVGTLQSRAVTLDWNTVTWVPGTLTGYFEVDASNPGLDISVTISGSVGDFLSGFPVDNNTFGGQESLNLSVDFPSENAEVVVTVNFHYAQGVTDISFMLFDIDRETGGPGEGYRDLVGGMYAQFESGPALAPTSVSGGTEVSVSGSGTNVTIRGDSLVADNGGDGNATIDYGTNIVRSFQFTYGNHNTAPKDPGPQGIGLYNIEFTPRPRLPETGTKVGAAIFCLVVIFLKRRGLIGGNGKRDAA